MRRSSTFALGSAILAVCSANSLVCAVTSWTNANGNGLWGDAGNWSNGLPDGNVAILNNPVGTIDLGGVTRSAIYTSVSGSGFTLINGAINSDYTITSASGLELAIGLTTTSSKLSIVTSGGVSPPIVSGVIGSGSFDVIANAAFTNSNSYSGKTIVRSLLTLMGGGAILNSTSVDVTNSTLQLNLAPGVNTRMSDVATLLLSRGGLEIHGSADGSSTETVGVLNLFSGANRARIGYPADFATLHGSSLARNSRATAEIAIDTAAGARMTFDQAPTPIPSGSPTQLPILPYVVGNSPGSPVTFLTYDRGADANNAADDIGLRPLNSLTELESAIAPGVGAANVRLTSPQTVTVDSTVNSLALHDASVSLSGASLSIASGGVLVEASGTAVPVDISGDGRLIFPAEAAFHTQKSLLVSVPITATSLTKTGTGDLKSTQPNTWSGGVFLNDGILISGKQGALGSGTIRLASGTLRFENEPQVLGNSLTIANNSNSDLNRESAPALIDVPSGLVVSISGSITGINSFSKVGGGTLRLLGVTSQPVAATYVDAGALIVNGSYGAGTIKQVIVRAGGMIGGNGTLPLVYLEGALSPGDGVGILHAYAVGCAPGSILLFDLDGDAPGTGYDQLVQSSSTIYNDAALSIDLGYIPTTGTQFAIISNAGTAPIAPIFSSLPQGTVVSFGGSFFQISYTGGDGNDVVLTTVVPEPTLALLVPLGLLAGRRRRKPLRAFATSW